MSRFAAVLTAVAVLLASGGAGVIGWLLSRNSMGEHPSISAYSNGRLTRVGPYFFCDVLNLNDCQNSATQGVLAVDGGNPVQLSVPSQIGAVPWRLLKVFEDPSDTTGTIFRPDTSLAVTIPTVDPPRGRLQGFTVQLLTLIQDEKGELREVPHAEWSVRTLWD